MRSDIDHYQGLVHWGPYDEPLLAPLLDRFDLAEDDKALDVGCGHGALLLTLAKRFGVKTTGVDRSEAALQRARAQFAETGLSQSATWLQTDADELRFDDGAFDVAAWMGGPFVGGSHASTVATLARWLRPGGYLLLGQGYWIDTPPKDYLDATGLPLDALTTEAEMLEPVLAAGLRVLTSAVSSRAVWDHFEGTILRNHEAYAAAHPDDPDVQKMIAGKRQWDDAQQRWGRDVMGFSVYVLQK